MTLPDRTFTVRQLLPGACISHRQLQLWTETGLVAYSMEKHKKTFSSHAALALFVIAEMLRRGLTLHQIRKARPFSAICAKRFEKYIAKNEEVYWMVTDKGRVLYCRSVEMLLNNMAVLRGSAATIDVTRQVRRLMRCV